MSRIGKQPVKIAKGVKVALNGRQLKVEGPKGKLSREIPESIALKIAGEEITVSKVRDDRLSNQLHGLTRTLVSNMINGCVNGFTKELDIVGVGYRASTKGQTLSMTLGFSHQVDYDLPAGITAAVDKNTHITLTGADKELLGVVAAKIRGFRPPEPYQGKGVKYSNEHIVRKQGKAAAGAAGGGK